LLAIAISSRAAQENRNFLNSFDDLLSASSAISPAPTPLAATDNWIGDAGFEGPAGELRDELTTLDDRHSGDTMSPDCSVPGAPCVGSGDAQYCGGHTIKGATEWTVFGEHRTNALMLHVDTSKCGYRNTPIYLVNVVGDASVPLTVSILLYSFTPVSLRVLVSHEAMAAADILNFARTQWSLSWMGATGRNCGITGFFKDKPAGWEQKPSAPSLLYLDVDTSAKSGEGSTLVEGASFHRPASVRYFTSFVARKLHWRGKRPQNINRTQYTWLELWLTQKLPLQARSAPTSGAQEMRREGCFSRLLPSPQMSTTAPLRRASGSISSSRAATAARELATQLANENQVQGLGARSCSRLPKRKRWVGG
jgi:hypothetical protein